jgi:hypothetical protein
MRALTALLLLTACSGLHLNTINHSVRKPSNVAVYFTVDKSNGDPVGGLTADRFRIYEDGSPVSTLESKQVILNPQVAAAHYTLLLVDMSGSVTQSGQVPQLQAAAQAFTSRVEQYQKVGVYAFDGSPNLTPIAGFSEHGGAGGVNALGHLHPRDPSTNLHGAVVQGIQTLQKALESAPQPIRIGTLVVFTDGTDHAARVSRDDMMKAINDAPFDIFAIGVGAEIDKGELSSIGRNGTVLEANPQAVQQAFEQIAARIEGYSKRYYLLSYCSPARAGQHQLRIEAVTPDGAHGWLEDQFDAAGFTPNCDPNQAPAFDVHHPQATKHAKAQ